MDVVGFFLEGSPFSEESQALFHAFPGRQMAGNLQL